VGDRFTTYSANPVRSEMREIALSLLGLLNPEELSPVRRRAAIAKCTPVHFNAFHFAADDGFEDTLEKEEPVEFSGRRRTAKTGTLSLKTCFSSIKHLLSRAIQEYFPAMQTFVRDIFERGNDEKDLHHEVQSLRAQLSALENRMADIETTRRPRSFPREGKLDKYERMKAFGVPPAAVERARERDGVLLKEDNSSAGLIAASEAIQKRVSFTTPHRPVIQPRDLLSATLRATPRLEEPVHGRRNHAGAVPSLEELNAVELRSATEEKENSRFAPNLEQLASVRLRKTDLTRSPGGTPASKPTKELRSPSTARSNGEFLELSLKRKFANVYAAEMSPQRGEKNWLPSNSPKRI